MTFLQPGRLWWLWLLAGVLLLYIALSWRSRHRQTSNSWRIQKVLPRQDRWKRHIAVALAIVSLGALIVAAAQPAAETRVPRDRATVVMVLDISHSMKATDIEPSRIAAMQKNAKEFARQIPSNFNLALVTFAATANLVVPPTTDRSVVLDKIDSIKTDPSTAIGEGIYTGLEALSLAPPDPDDPKKRVPAAMVLLSDGVTNVGRKSADAADKAKQLGCPVYSIAYGTRSASINIDGQTLPVGVGYAELREVAKRSGGKYFEATSGTELKEVYDKISSQVGYTIQEAEITKDFIGWALLSALLASLGVISVAARWP